MSPVQMERCAHDGTATGLLKGQTEHRELVPMIVCEQCGATLSVGAPIVHEVRPGGVR